MTDQGLQLTTSAGDGTLETRGMRVVARGEIDIETAPRLTAMLDRVIDDGARIVVLDARDVGFIDSTGLRAIIAAGNRLSDRDGHLMIEGMSGAVQTVLEISGLIDRYRATTMVEDEEGTSMSDSAQDPAIGPAVDPIDAEAAHIDARSEEAAEEIQELIEHARELGRDAPAEVDPDAVER